MSGETQHMPENILAIKKRGFVVWATDQVSEDFRTQFDEKNIPVRGVRHVRVWGLQVDDERELPGHERTNIPDEDIWEINLQAKDGSCYEVESRLVKPAPE